MKTILLAAWVLFLTGCTFVHKPKELTIISIGTDRKIDVLKYGSLEIQGLNSNASKGLGTAAQGAAQGFSGNPAPALQGLGFIPNLKPSAACDIPGCAVYHGPPIDWGSDK